MKNKLKNIILIMMVIVFSINTMVFGKTPDPVLQAQAAILVDAKTGKVLYEKNSEEKMFPASMTKILTAIVTLDHFSPDALVTVGTEINEITLDSSKAGHIVGETLSVENLIRGLIIPSGNDSANVLAAAVARKVKNDNSLSYEECGKIFAELMNEKATSLGAKNTHFTQGHGYHNVNHYTTAADMAIFAIEAMKNETIKKIAGEKSFTGNGAGNTLESDADLKTQDYNWKSHNLLITSGEYYYENATGLKTGFTNEAGSCVAATATKDEESLVAVVFNSEDPNRWIDAKSLFEFGFENFDYVDIQKNGDVVETVGLVKHNRLNGDTLNVVVKEDLTDYLNEEDAKKIEKEIIFTESLIVTNKNQEDKTIRLTAPLEKDSEIGVMTYKIDGEVIHESKIYAADNVEKSTILTSVKYFFKNMFDKLFTLKGIITFVVIVAVIIILFLIIRRNKQSRSRYKYKYKNPRRRR